MHPTNNGGVTMDKSHPRAEGNGSPEDAPTVRRFAPQLVETSKRTRKSSDVPLSKRDTDSTDLSSGDKVHLPRHFKLERLGATPIPPENSPAQSSEYTPQLLESRFSSASLIKRAARRTSFRVPHLAPITSQEESDDSNESNVPSLSTTASALSDENELQKQAARVTETCDERFSGYLLALAAGTAEKQLKEQALAAYPNEEIHEPVDHFAVDRDSDASETETSNETAGRVVVNEALFSRRESEAGWDMAEMRRHKKYLEWQREEQRTFEEDQSSAPSVVGDLFLNPIANIAAKGPEQSGNSKNVIGAQLQEEGELKKMRDAASPPMLGRDIEFRKFVSPQSTRIDATQKPRMRAEGMVSREHSGLWTLTCDNTFTRTKDSSPAGLWHGVCNGPQHEPSSPVCIVQTGLLTPIFEPDDPLGKPHSSSASIPDKHQLPPTPGSSLSTCSATATLSGIDAVLSLEASMASEYTDSFVTQIYNYLSLGYPALARKFDTELSKISNVPVADIRRGDAGADSKGYVGAPEGEGVPESVVRDTCGRWLALKLYIWEWARQQPRMRGEEKGEWGARARKGSWAI